MTTPVADTAEDLLRQLDRLHSQEQEERNERRGLEQRATSTLAASLVLIGLALTAITQQDNLETRAVVCFGIGVALVIMSCLALILVLGGVHTSASGTFRDAIKRPSGPVEIPLEPSEPTAHDVQKQLARVTGIATQNTVVVRTLRLASLAIGIGLLSLVTGVLYGLV